MSVFIGRFLAPFFRGSQALAFSVGLKDVHPVGKAVQQRAGEALVTEYLGPTLKGQFVGKQDALPFVGAAEQLEEEFGDSHSRDGSCVPR